MLVSFLEKMGIAASSSGLYGQVTVSETEPLWHLHMSGSLFSNQFSWGVNRRTPNHPPLTMLSEGHL